MKKLSFILFKRLYFIKASGNLQRIPNLKFPDLLTILLVFVFLLQMDPVFGQYKIGSHAIDTAYGKKLQKRIDRLSQSCTKGNRNSCNKIIDIAKNHNNIFYSYYAVNTITDPTVLIDIAKKARFSSISIAAVEKISDENALRDIVKSPNANDVLIAAIKKINDQKFLEEMAIWEYDGLSRDKDIRIAAIERITNQSLLAEICRRDLNEQVCYSALKRITDQNILADIVQKDGNKDLRAAALKQISDQHVLAIISLNNKISLSESAFYMITDQNILGYVALNCKNSLYYEPVKNITDQSVLTDIAKNAENNDIRAAAIRKLSDQNILVDIVRNSKSWSDREEAVRKITDQFLLAEIVKGKYDFASKEGILTRALAFKGIHNLKTIADIIRNTQDFEFWEKVTQVLTDQEVLMEIILYSESHIIKCFALISLDAQENYQNILSIINNNIKSDPNLSAIAALKAIPFDKVLKKYYTLLETEISQDLKSVEYLVYGPWDWTMVDYEILLKINNTDKTFSYLGERGHQKELVSEIVKWHVGTINISEICRFLLAPLSRDNLSEISNSSEIIYLCETAKAMLR